MLKEKEEKKKNKELIDPFRYIRNLLCEEQHIPLTTIVRFDVTCIQ